MRQNKTVHIKTKNRAIDIIIFKINNSKTNKQIKKRKEI